MQLQAFDGRAWLLLMLIACALVWAGWQRAERKAREAAWHKHQPREWDGYWESCRCGARRVGQGYPWQGGIEEAQPGKDVSRG
jgi:hypothetical protein